MNTIDVAICCVDPVGLNWIPGNKEYIHDSTMQAQYSNRKLFSADKEILLVEQIKTDGNNAWMYYQYMFFGIFDASDRAESIFGLTVVTDTLCSDANLILDLCRKAFNKYVVGTILQPKEGTYKVCATLSSQESVRKAIVSFFAKILATYRELGILEDLPILTSPLLYQPVSLNNEKQVLCRLNPDDATPAKIIGQIKAGKKVAVSDNYPTVAQQSMIDEKARISDELHVCKNKLADTETSLDNANKKASDALLSKNKLQSEISNLKDDNNRNSKKLQDEIERMKREHEAEISKYKAQGNYPMQKQLDEINAKIDKLLHKDQAIQPPELQENQRHKLKKDKNKQQRQSNLNAPGFDRNNRTKYIVAAIIIIVIVFVLLSVSMCSGDEKDTDKNEEKDKTEYFDDKSSDNASSIQNIPAVTITLDKSYTDNFDKDVENPNKSNAFEKIHEQNVDSVSLPSDQ